MKRTRVAFYAPMKSPRSEVASGDRTIARLLMAALEAGACDVRLASELKTWTRTSEAVKLRSLIDISYAEADRLTDEFRSNAWCPELWFTYHVYYKAPDWIGPRVAEQLGIPYMIAEATFAGKRDHDHWTPWQAEARKAMQAADTILCFTERDRDGVLHAGVAADTAKLFPPFLAPGVAMTQRAGRSIGDKPVELVVVAMMRPGDKRESYQFLARSLQQLQSPNWRLTVVGDGRAADDVRADFAGLGTDRITFVGALDPAGVQSVLSCSDLFVWPGIGEAFGMAYLEAQAMGLPVVALSVAGVPAVVRHGVSGLLVDQFEPAAFAEAIDALIKDTPRRMALSNAAIAQIQNHHLFEVAVRSLKRLIGEGLISKARE